MALWTTPSGLCVHLQPQQSRTTLEMGLAGLADPAAGIQGMDLGVGRAMDTWTAPCACIAHSLRCQLMSTLQMSTMAGTCRPPRTGSGAI